MIESSNTFAKALTSFPTEVREHFEAIRLQGGVLHSPQVEAVLQLLNIEIHELMIQLLPLASVYAQVPISGFAIGAIAAGTEAIPSLYLGANLEFEGEALSFSVHAEQAAMLSAWREDECGVKLLAVSAPPCGYCRQFLSEFETADSRMLVIVSGPSGTLIKHRLSDLLPSAFGPLELGAMGGPMHPHRGRHRLGFVSNVRDELAREALQAAKMSYAPYSQSYAGCAIRTESGQIYHGAYVENAAYNPSLSPFQVALSIMNLRLRDGESKTIERVVLAERSTNITQLHLTECLLKTIGANLKLDYFRLKEFIS